MRPRNHLDRIHITFDDHRLVNNAGLAQAGGGPAEGVDSLQVLLSIV